MTSKKNILKIMGIAFGVFFMLPLFTGTIALNINPVQRTDPTPSSIIPGSNVPWGIRINFPNDPRTSATIIWFTNSTPSYQKVEFGITSTNYTMEKSATYKLQVNKYIVTADLTFLIPDTRYYYRVGSDTDGWTGEYNFTTAPDPKTSGVHFAVFGDSRTNRDARRMVADLILQNGSQFFGTFPEFILHVGDVVASGGNLGEWQNYFWDMQPLLGNLPIYPVEGNHDLGSVNQGYYPQEFVLPQDAGSEWYYSFNWGPLHVSALDSETHGIPPYDQFSDKWLQSDLEKENSDTNILWDLAFFHQPFFSSGPHAERIDLRNTWGPLFDKYGVDIVFNGHDHNYERIYPISYDLKYNTTENTTYNSPKYPIYVTTGCAAMGNPSEVAPNPKPYSVMFNASWHYCDVNISLNKTAKTTTMEVYVIGSTSYYTNTSFILDHFSITKNIPDSYFTSVDHVDYTYHGAVSDSEITVCTIIILAGIVFVNVIILRRRFKAINKR